MTKQHDNVRHLGDRRTRTSGNNLGRRAHDEAVLRAEIKRLVRALGPYRVLRRDALMREAGTRYWHEAMFDRALQAAVEAHVIDELPLGFYRLPHARPDAESGSDGASAA